MRRVPRPSITCSRADPPGSLSATETFADILAFFDTGWVHWWIAGFALFVVADTGLTVVGAGLGTRPEIRFTELNAGLVGMGARFGFIQTMVVVKAAVYGGLFIVWRVAPWPERSLVPLLITIAGALATGWNLGMLTLVILRL